MSDERMASPGPVGDVKPPPKSEAQQKLDRGLAACNRYNDLRKRLDAVVDRIAEGRVGRAESPGRTTKPAQAVSLFAGLDMVDDGHVMVANELEQTIGVLEQLI